MELEEFKEINEKKVIKSQEKSQKVFTRLEEIKGAVGKVLKEEIERLVGNENIQNLPEYTKVAARNNVDFFEKADHGMLCDIIGKYSVEERISGKDEFDDDLQKAYELKNSKKTGLKERAEEVIREYKQIIEYNRQVIDDFKENINGKKSEIKSLRDSISQVAAAATKNEHENSVKLREEFIKKNEEKIGDIEVEIEILHEELLKFEEEQINHEFKIKTLISEFEDKFKEKAKIDIGSYTKSDKNPSENGTENSGSVTTNRINKVINVKDSKRRLAKRMLLDIQDMNESDMVTLINQYGYKDLLVMSENLGPVGRIQARNILKGVLSNNALNEWGLELSRGLKGISDNDLARIKKDIQEFNQNILDKTPDEILKFQKKIETLNIASLYTVAKTGKLKQFVNKFTTKGNILRTLNQELVKFSNKRYERKTSEINTSNRLRKIINVTPKKDLRPRVFLDKDKKSSIYEDRSR